MRVAGSATFRALASFLLTLVAALIAPGAVQHVAAAGAVPEVTLELQRCPTLPLGQVARQLALELDARVVPPGNGGPDATRGVIVCGGAGLQLEVSDPLTGRFLSRPLSPLGRDPDAAARIAALALAELIFTSWIELPSRPAGAPAGDTATADVRRAALERAQRHAANAPPSAATPAEPAAALPAGAQVFPERSPPGERAAPTPDAPTTLSTGAAAVPAARADDAAYLLAVGQVTGPFDGVGLGWGAGARAGWTSGAALIQRAAVSASLGADADVIMTWADAGSALGSVRVSTWTAAPRASLRLFVGGGRSAWFDLGLGARAGLARLVGAPVDPSSARGNTLGGLWSGAAAFLGLGLSLGPLVAAAGLEGGQVLRSVSGTVDGDRAVAISGRWLAGSLALGWGR